MYHLMCIIHFMYSIFLMLKRRYFYLAMKKNEIMPFAATRMQQEMIILSEVSQKEKNKYYMISLICGIKYDTNDLSPEQKQTHRRREQTCGC